jgi:hypothetical protein
MVTLWLQADVTMQPTVNQSPSIERSIEGLHSPKTGLLQLRTYFPNIDKCLIKDRARDIARQGCLGIIAVLSKVSV